MVAISLKMYLDRPETLAWIRRVVQLSDHDRFGSLRVLIFPSLTEVPAALALTRRSRVEVGAQNAAAALSGAFTGEVSARSLAQLGCRSVELGHAERRTLFGETDSIIAAKARLAAEVGLTPLLCVGETTKMTPAGAAKICSLQLDTVLKVVPETAPLIVAYEPAWAIGTQSPAPADYVDGVLRHLRARLDDRNNDAPLLYGGSAGIGTMTGLRAADGLFLGRFAHDTRQLERIMDEVRELAA
ncbi:triosephosphate isomerase [Acrocarpospora pleiomorpha]|uniref:Triosephosphate isomerase n=2 Tax=Acrocarpospora pleiomorpha TaxID=90975 RepID=A0A5M3XSU6_9ACTN|nr:triosephosphate isomerase [Acrocarpospora pleiomorpha]